MPRQMIDALAFCGVWPKWPVPCNLSTEGASYLDKYGIDRAVVSSLEAVFYDCDGGNEECLNLAARESRFVATCAVTPHMGSRALNVVEECVAAGARAVRLYPQHHEYDLEAEPSVAEICAKAAELGLPVWLAVRVIMDWSLPVLNVNTILRTARRFPDTDFIVSGVNYGEFRPLLAALSVSENLYVELSSFQMLGGIEQIVSLGGADKLLFGTGLPLQYPLCNTLKVDVAEITDEDKERLFCLNARRLFKI